MANYKIVQELNGIELYFDKKPKELVLNRLRESGWRWHFSKRCWYTRRSPSAEKLAKELCKNEYENEIGAQDVSVSVLQYLHGAYVSTLTITRHGREFYVTSTNNLIICSDCKMFFSVHASACPHCGCPMSHVAETTYNYFHPNAAKKREEALVRETQKYKNEQIQELINYCATSRDFHKIMALDAETFDSATKRAMYLDDIAEEIPNLDNMEWWNLLTMDENEYWDRIEELKEEKDREKIKVAAEAAEHKLYTLKVRALCCKHGIDCRTTDRVIETRMSYEELEERIQAIKYYMGIYPNIGLMLENDIFVSVEVLKKRIYQMIRCRMSDVSVCVTDMDLSEFEEDIPF